MDQSLYIFHWSLGKGLQRWKAAEKGRGDLIYPFVCTLGRETDGEEEFVVFFVAEAAEIVWVVMF